MVGFQRLQVLMRLDTGQRLAAVVCLERMPALGGDGRLEMVAGDSAAMPVRGLAVGERIPFRRLLGPPWYFLVADVGQVRQHAANGAREQIYGYIRPIFIMEYLLKPITRPAPGPADASIRKEGAQHLLTARGGLADNPTFVVGF